MAPTTSRFLFNDTVVLKEIKVQGEPGKMTNVKAHLSISEVRLPTKEKGLKFELARLDDVDFLYVDTLSAHKYLEIADKCNYNVEFRDFPKQLVHFLNSVPQTTELISLRCPTVLAGTLSTGKSRCVLTFIRLFPDGQTEKLSIPMQVVRGEEFSKIMLRLLKEENEKQAERITVLEKEKKKSEIEWAVYKEDMEDELQNANCMLEEMEHRISERGTFSNADYAAKVEGALLEKDGQLDLFQAEMDAMTRNFNKLGLLLERVRNDKDALDEEVLDLAEELKIVRSRLVRKEDLLERLNDRNSVTDFDLAKNLISEHMEVAVSLRKIRLDRPTYYEEGSHVSKDRRREENDMSWASSPRMSRASSPHSRTILSENDNSSMLYTTILPEKTVRESSDFHSTSTEPIRSPLPMSEIHSKVNHPNYRRLNLDDSASNWDSSIFDQ